MGKSLIDDISEARHDRWSKAFDRLDVLERAARRESKLKPVGLPSRKASGRITSWGGGDMGNHMTAKRKGRITLPKVWK